MGHVAIKFSVIEPGAPVAVGGRRLCAVPVEHSVPTVAYHLAGGTGSLVVASDMTVSDAFWPTVNGIGDLRYLLIESAFQNSRIDLCEITGHLCPSLVGQELRRLQRPADVFITHMKPSAKPQIQLEIAALGLDIEIGFLAAGDVLNL